MIFYRWCQKRLCWVTSRPMPISIFILIHPWCRSTSLRVYARRQFNVRSVRGVGPNVHRRFSIIHFVGYAVSELASVNRREVFCVPFCLLPDTLKRALDSLAKLTQNLAAVVNEANISHGFLPIPPTRHMSTRLQQCCARSSGLSRAFFAALLQCRAFLLCAACNDSFLLLRKCRCTFLRFVV